MVRTVLVWCRRLCETLPRVVGALAVAIALSATAQPTLFSAVAVSPGPGKAVPDEQASDPLWSGEATPTARALPGRVVRIDTTQLAAIRADLEVRGTSPEVLLNLFDGTVHAAVFERIEATSVGYSLTGRLRGVRFGTVTLVVDGDLVAGAVRTPTKTYVIRSVGVGVHRVQEVGPAVLTGDDVVESPMFRTRPGLRELRQSSDAAADSGAEIDVMVFYTRDARIALGGARRTRAQIDLAVAETNAAYESGGVVQRIRLVRAVETAYAETDNELVDFGRFHVDGDGHMDEVHALRDAYAADLLVLVVKCCGGWALGGPYDPASGFSLSSLSGGYWLDARVFAHELGHNMGLAHDRYVNPGNWPFPYSHGYVNQAAFDAAAPDDACWHTIMAYSYQCWDAGLESVTVLHFSNPRQRYPGQDGDPMGVPGDEPSDALDGPADAVRSLNETRVSVARFRASTVRCVYRVSPPEIEVASDGGSFLFDVEVKGENCPREAKTHDAFLALVPTGTESAFRVRVEPNDGWARFGTVTVGAETIEVRQKGSRTMADTCDRSPWMREAIVALAGREDCAGVTEFDIASILEIDLSSRDIEGTVRSGDFDGFAGLWLLDLSANRLSGVFPDAVGLRRLEELNLRENNFSGDLPAHLGNLDRLMDLRLGRNAFTGPIPPELGNLGRLQVLGLQENQLTGPVPPELGRLGQLWSLHLWGNDLSGELPAQLGNLDRLIGLSLSSNAFTGPIPPELGNLGRLLGLDLQHNRLTGTVPAELGRLSRLRTLWLHGNDLSGPVPRTLGKLNLDRLLMQRNLLDGCIPGSLERFADGINPQRGKDGSTERNLPPCPVPGETALAIEWARDGRLTVSYGAPSEFEPVSGYEYRLSTDGGVTWAGDWTTILLSGPGEANAKGYTIGGLVDGTRYTLGMRAVNAEGTGPVATVSVVLGAWLPGRVEASGEPGKLRVFWDAAEGAVSYVVEWRTEHQEFHASRRREFSDGTTMATIAGLDGDTLYFVRVSAVLDSTHGYPPASTHAVVTKAQHRPFLRGWRLGMPLD